jgi:hypothetical protein
VGAAELLVAATTAACRPELAPGVAELAARARPGSLGVVAEFAELHRVDGCVHAVLAEAARAGVPVDPAALERLAAGRRHIAARHLLVRAALARAGAVLDAAGVPWLTFKGPVLSSQLYCDPGFRRYSDLDVLVPPERFADAVAALERSGYRNQVTLWAPQLHYVAGAIALHDGVIATDLHWHVLYKRQERRWYRIDPDELFARRVTVDVGDQPCATFDPVDTLIHIALHAAREGCRCLVWLKDIERTVAVTRPDFDEVVQRARAAQCGRPVGIALARAKWTLDAAVPDSAIRALVGRVWPGVVRRVSALDDPVSVSPLRSPGALLTRETRLPLLRTPSWVAARLRDRVAERRIGRLLERGFDPETCSAGERARNEADRAAYLERVRSWRVELG